MNMYWRKNGEIVNIKRLSRADIKSSLNYLRETSKTKVNGYTVPFWILSFKRELEYRKRLEKTIINALPNAKWFNEKLNEITYNIKYKK